jgi:hypothetical protein
MAALAVGPTLGCHILLRDGSPGAQAVALASVAKTLRAANIPARLPCRVWVLQDRCSSEALQIATMTRAGRIGANHTDPIELRNALIKSIRSIHPLRPKRDRIAASQDALRLFREPALPSLDHATPQSRDSPSGLAAEVKRVKLESDQAELDQEQLLARSFAWQRGARLVRGVAGSGKTCVMAWATAMLARKLQSDPGCPDPRMLLVSPFKAQLRDLSARVSACLSLEGAPDPTAASLPQWIRVGHWPELAIQLASAMRMKGTRAKPLVAIEQWLLEAVRTQKPSTRRWSFDAIVIDEAQTLSDQAIEILARLGDRRRTGDPTLHLYFDDAQAPENMHRRPPLWKRLGVQVKGRRSVLLDRCYRTPTEIMEPALNMLVGSLVGFEKPQTTGHADLARLCRKGLIEPRADGWHRVRFAVRHGPDPQVRLIKDRQEGFEQAARLAHALTTRDGIEPTDIAIIAPSAVGCGELCQVSSRLALPGLLLQTSRSDDRSYVGRDQERGIQRVVAYTVKDVRGLEWPVVILVGWDRLSNSSAHRSALYIAMTRCQHLLHLITDAQRPLMREAKKCIDRSRMIRLESDFG